MKLETQALPCDCSNVVSNIWEHTCIVFGTSIILNTQSLHKTENILTYVVSSPIHEDRKET